MSKDDSWQRKFIFLKYLHNYRDVCIKSIDSIKFDIVMIIFDKMIDKIKIDILLIILHKEWKLFYQWQKWVQEKFIIIPRLAEIIQDKKISQYRN